MSPRAPKSSPADTEWKGRTLRAMRESGERLGAQVWTSVGYVHVLYPDALRLDIAVTMLPSRDALASALERMVEVVRAGQEALAEGPRS
ncbi:MAG: hypothetical protein IT379_40030 [Deltaproteobacteria bacterium]|nr:hypothetical protein [Deltaproteobacteria bacterium]